MPELLDRVIVEILGDDSKLKAALDRAERSATRAAGRIESAFGRAVGPSTRLLGSVTVLGGALSALGIKAVGMAGDMEQARIGLTTMLGSAEAADKHLRELYDFAAKTPFEIDGLIDADRRLMAMGFSAEEVIPTLTAVGDAVAAVGGSAELLDRVTLALGQMRAKGKVSGEEMRQLAEAGIPAWEMLADAIGTSIPEAMKLAERGAIDATTGIEAILDGMNKRFAGSMEAQSQTVVGMWSNVKDNVTRSMIALGEEITDALDVRGILQISLQALERFRAWLERGGLRQWWEDYKDTLVVVAGAIAGALTPAVVALGTALWGALAPLTPFIAVGAALAGAFVLLGGTMDDVKVALKTLGVLFSGLWDIFVGFVQGTIGKLAALDDAWRAYISGVSIGISNMGQAIDAVIHGRFHEAMEWARGAVDAWKGGLSAAWGEIADAGQEGADRIYQGLVKISDVVTGQVGASFAEAKEKAQEVADTAASGFGVKVPAATKATGQAINTNVLQPLNTAVEKAKELGDYLSAAQGTLYGRQPKPVGLGMGGAVVAPRGATPPTAGGARIDYNLADFDVAAREAAQAVEELTDAQRRATRDLYEMYRSLGLSADQAGVNRLGLTPPPEEPSYNVIQGSGSSDYGSSREPGLGRGGAIVAPREGSDIAGGARLDYNLANFDVAAREAGKEAEGRRKSIEWLGKFANGLKGALGALNPFGAILEAINPIGTIIQSMLEELQPVLGPIVDLFSEIGVVLAKLLAPILKALTPVLKMLVKAFEFAAKIVAGIWNAIARAVNAILGWMGVHLELINLEADEAKKKIKGECDAERREKQKQKNCAPPTTESPETLVPTQSLSDNIMQNLQSGFYQSISGALTRAARAQEWQTELRANLKSTVLAGIVQGLMQSKAIKSVLDPLLQSLTEAIVGGGPTRSLITQIINTTEELVGNLAGALMPLSPLFRDMGREVQHTTETLQRMSDSTYNLPTWIKLDAYRFRADTPQGRGAGDIVINIQAPVYGVDHLRNVIEEALRRERYAQYGTTGGV